MSLFRKSVRRGALLLLLAAGLSGAANAAPITYDIDFSIGAAKITGSILTDGTLGALTPSLLNPSQILDWNLTASDSTHTCANLGGGLGGPCTVNFAGPFGTVHNGGLQTDGLFGNNLIASPTQLIFDFSAGPGFLFFAGTPGGEICLSAGGICTIGLGSNSAVRINPGFRLVLPPFQPNNRVDYQYQNLSGRFLLGTATPVSVPEPSSLAVMAGALAMLLLGFPRFRRVASSRA